MDIFGGLLINWLFFGSFIISKYFGGVLSFLG